MRPWSLAGWLVALVAVAFLVVETRAIAEEAGRLELDLRAARAELARRAPAAPTEPASAAASPPPVEATAYAQLALELATTKDQLAAVRAVLEARNQQDAERAQRAAAEAERRNKPMPEGVRECLLALHECLRAEGFLGPRFLHAEAVGKDGLAHVEMLEPDAAGLDVAVVQAARMTATVERATGRFVLRFYDGERSVRGVAKPLPKDGHALAFADVDGRLIEQRLPYLVAVEGEYPAPAATPGKAPGELDPIQRRQWVERLDAVLAQGGGAPRWRVQRLRGLLDGWFLGVELVGVDDKRHVVAGASCERLAIELDEAANVVSLRLCDGSLRRSGVDSSITGEGLRMLLPAMNCKQATDAMFGMVVRR
jgi:hypothetical protein